MEIISAYLYKSIPRVQEVLMRLSPSERDGSLPPAKQPLLIVVQRVPIYPLAASSEDGLQLHLQQNVIFIP